MNWSVAVKLYSLSFRSVMPPNSDRRPSSALVSSPCLSFLPLPLSLYIPLLLPPSLPAQLFWSRFFMVFERSLSSNGGNLKATIDTAIWDSSDLPALWQRQHLLESLKPEERRLQINVHILLAMQWTAFLILLPPLLYHASFLSSTPITFSPTPSLFPSFLVSPLLPFLVLFFLPLFLPR